MLSADGTGESKPGSHVDGSRMEIVRSRNPQA
jgi:hypothetical protein